MRHPMQTFHYYSMAATCLFLAYKVEECVRKMRELVVACVRVAQKDPHKMVDEQKCMTCMINLDADSPPPTVPLRTK